MFKPKTLGFGKFNVTANTLRRKYVSYVNNNNNNNINNNDSTIMFKLGVLLKHRNSLVTMYLKACNVISVYMNKGLKSIANAKVSTNTTHGKYKYKKDRGSKKNKFQGGFYLNLKNVIELFDVKTQKWVTKSEVNELTEIPHINSNESIKFKPEEVAMVLQRLHKFACLFHSHLMFLNKEADEIDWSKFDKISIQ